MRVSFLFLFVICIGFSLNQWFGLGILGLAIFLCTKQYIAEEKRIDGVMRAYAIMAKRDRMEARRGVIRFR